MGLSRRVKGVTGRFAGLVKMPRRTLNRTRQRVRRWLDRRGMRATTADELALAVALRAELHPAAVTTGPLVSIVILNRDGYAHLDRCLRALALTTYRDLEVIVVDNGSSDGSPELVGRLDLPFPAQVVRNPENRPFGEANAQGLAAARGDLICLLNNDVEPITEDWLGYLVETISDGTDAVGARLIYPSHRGSKRAAMHIPDLRLQHGGVDFDRAHGIPLPQPVGAGAPRIGDPRLGCAPRPRPCREEPGDVRRQLGAAPVPRGVARRAERRTQALR
jgi:hypothetical protein